MFGVSIWVRWTVLRKFQPFFHICFTNIWKFWSLYGNRKRNLCKIRWTVEWGMRNRAAVRILSEELFWNGCLTCSIVLALVEGISFPLLWSTLPNHINACCHLRISVRHGRDFCMTRRTHLHVSVTNLVRWYSERIRAFTWVVNDIAEFLTLRQSFTLKWEIWKIYYQNEAYSLIHKPCKFYKILSGACHLRDEPFPLSSTKIFQIVRFQFLLNFKRLSQIFGKKFLLWKFERVIILFGAKRLKKS